MSDEFTDHQILFLYVLATRDMGTGMTEAEIERAIEQMPDDEKSSAIAKARGSAN